MPLMDFLDHLSVLILSFLEARKAFHVLAAFIKAAALTTEITLLFPISVLTIAFSSFLQCLQQLSLCKSFGIFYQSDVQGFHSN